MMRWALVLVAGCAQPLPRPDSDGRQVPERLPCPGRILPGLDPESDGMGPLVWDGHSFILHQGFRLEAWSTQGVVRWSQPLVGPGTLWRQGGETRALDGMHDILRVSPEGVVSRLPWVTLKEARAPRVLPIAGERFWVVDEWHVWRVEGDTVVFERHAHTEPREHFGQAAVGPDGRLHVVMWRWSEPKGAEFKVVVFGLDGQRHDGPVDPDFAPLGLTFDSEGRLLVMGVHGGDGRVVGLEAGVQDYEPPFGCRHGEAVRGGVNRLLPMRGGEWLAVGSFCASHDSRAIWLLRLAADGAVRWQARVDLMNENTLHGVAVADDGHVALSGTMRACCYDTVGGELPWVMFVDPEGRCLDAVR